MIEIGKITSDKSIPKPENIRKIEKKIRPILLLSKK